MGLPNKDLLPDDLEDLVFDALRRANLPTHCVLIHYDAIVVQRKGGVIVVPVAVRTILAPPTDEEAPHAYDTHLVIKHVDLNNWDFKNDGTARERTRESFAKECAFYRDVVAASRASRGGRNEVVTRAFDPINGWGMAQMETGADGWAVPTAHLVEGDETLGCEGFPPPVFQRIDLASGAKSVTGDELDASGVYTRDGTGRVIITAGCEGFLVAQYLANESPSGELAAAGEVLNSGTFPTRALLDETYSLDGIDEAMAMLERRVDGRDAVRVGLVHRAAG